MGYVQAAVEEFVEKIDKFGLGVFIRNINWHKAKSSRSSIYIRICVIRLIIARDWLTTCNRGVLRHFIKK